MGTAKLFRGTVEAVRKTAFTDTQVLGTSLEPWGKRFADRDTSVRSRLAASHGFHLGGAGERSGD